jgi:hypothetical protein
MNYLQKLQKYTSGINQSSKNIETSDGKRAYVTSTGVTKLYPNEDVFNATSGKRNCGGTPTLLTPKWDDLGFPIGSAMISGQSCGNENSYVQASPPPTNFNWKYYIKSNPDLQLSTEKQAVDHWNSSGKYEGRLPNANIMSHMAATGKIGYVDVNTFMHPVRTPTYTSGVYTPFMGRSNVAGTNMINCTREVAPVRYGEELSILYRDKKGGLNTSSTIEFGTTSSPFVIRPPVGTDVQGRSVQYGDDVSLSTSMSNYTTDCGWWGCKVGKVNASTRMLEFGPGGENVSTMRIMPPPGSAYVLGSVLKFGDPFIFSTMIVKTDDRLIQGKSMTAGKSIKSENGKYMFLYQTDGNLCLYNTSGGGSIWCSGALHTPGKVVVQDDGNLVAYDSGGIPQWSSNTQGQGTGSYYLIMRNDRTVALMDSSNTVLWSTQTVSDATPPIPSTPMFAYVKNNTLTFHGTQSSVFVFKGQSTEPATCDVESLKSECDASECLGFIHSPASNEWQMITPTSQKSDFMISSNIQDIYVKNATVDVGDASCDPGAPQFVDSSLFSHYVKGADLKEGGTNQCNVLKPPKAHVVPDMHGGHFLKKIKDLNVSKTQSTTKQIGVQIDSKSKEFVNLAKESKQIGDMVTLEQQNMDLTVFDSYFKSASMTWFILAATLLTVMILK